jgi:hypothetical protein
MFIYGDKRYLKCKAVNSVNYVRKRTVHSFSEHHTRIHSLLLNISTRSSFSDRDTRLPDTLHQYYAGRCPLSETFWCTRRFGSYLYSGRQVTDCQFRLLTVFKTVFLILWLAKRLECPNKLSADRSRSRSEHTRCYKWFPRLAPFRVTLPYIITWKFRYVKAVLYHIVQHRVYVSLYLFYLT